MVWLLAPFALLVVNAMTALVFYRDKQAAIAGRWRTSEATLLTLALVGGSAGALWARRRFRHKTRKQPFVTILHLIVMVQAGVAIGLLTLLV